jgi:hypothetical protein
MEFHYAQYVPYSYQYPDLGLIVEIESAQGSSPQKSKKWMYVVGALTTLGLASFGFFANIPQLEQVSQQIQQDIYADYVSLIK